MIVNPVNGTIFVSNKKPIGLYTIKVVGTLPDSLTTSSAIFKIKVKENTPPIFAYPLPDVKVSLMTSYTYQFPKIINLEKGENTRISSVIDSQTGLLPSFIKFE